jgi:hypothetical protein
MNAQFATKASRPLDGCGSPRSVSQSRLREPLNIVVEKSRWS